MKLLILLTISLLFATSVLAQQDDLLKRLEERAVQVNDLEKKVQNLEKEKKELEKQLDQKKNNTDRQEKHLIDSISAPLNKLKAAVDSAKTELQTKDKRIIQLNDEFKNKLAIQKEQSVRDGQKNVLLLLTAKYQAPFENLIPLVTIYSIETDYSVFKKMNSEDLMIMQKMEKLMVYFNAKQLLENKFEKVRVEQAKESLLKLKKEGSSVTNLINLLDKFEIRKEGLINTISEIQKLNDLPAKGNEVIENEKWKEIWNNINQYIFSYGVNLEVYPNFRKTIFELLNIKKENIDSDVIGLTNEL